MSWCADLDYCSELLSLISKIGAIYVQDFADTVALEAVDQLSTLTNGLSRSIWQKIIIIENMRGPMAARRRPKRAFREAMRTRLIGNSGGRSSR